MTNPSTAPEPSANELRPGTEIRSKHFATQLLQRSANEAHISFEINLLREGSTPVSLHGASSYWFQELQDSLEFVLRQMRRDGASSSEYQALGRCIGVRVDAIEELTGPKEVRIMTEDDENWHPSQNSFDPSLLSELHTHLGDVIELLLKSANRDREGFGFEFKEGKYGNSKIGKRETTFLGNYPSAPGAPDDFIGQCMTVKGGRELAEAEACLRGHTELVVTHPTNDATSTITRRFQFEDGLRAAQAAFTVQLSTSLSLDVDFRPPDLTEST